MLTVSHPVTAQQSPAHDIEVTEAQQSQSPPADPSNSETSNNEEGKPKDENSLVESADRMIERSVMPVTDWIERKIQNSKVITPSPYHNKSAEQDTASKALNLRSAIKLATTEYPGTVLSADLIIEQGTEKFQIKILAVTGVIKVIEVDRTNPDQD
jgi:uncharacterized membrane protein YkoI